MSENEYIEVGGQKFKIVGSLVLDDGRVMRLEIAGVDKELRVSAETSFIEVDVSGSLKI